MGNEAKNFQYSKSSIIRIQDDGAHKYEILWYCEFQIH